VHGGDVTIYSGNVGASLAGRFSVGFSATDTTDPLDVGKFTGFTLMDYVGYLARRPCN
jgi:hypothetical protein